MPCNSIITLFCFSENFYLEIKHSVCAFLWVFWNA